MAVILRAAIVMRRRSSNGASSLRALVLSPSIDYRLLWKTLGHPGDIIRAMCIARAAIRWLRANAKKYSIDTDRIGAFGDSAGGMTAVYLATVSGEGDSGSPSFSSAVRAVATLSGARYPPPLNVSNITAAEPAYLDFHGCEDPFVRYDCNSDEDEDEDACWGSAVGTNNKLRAAGAIAGLYSFAGAGHSLGSIVEQGGDGDTPWLLL